MTLKKKREESLLRKKDLKILLCKKPIQDQLMTKKEDVRRTLGKEKENLKNSLIKMPDYSKK